MGLRLLRRKSLIALSTNKSRKLGWHGFVDSTEALLEVFHDLAKIKLIPPVPGVQDQNASALHTKTIPPTKTISFDTYRDIAAKKAKYGRYSDQKLLHKLSEVALPDATFTFYNVDGSIKVQNGREYHFTSLNDAVSFFSRVSAEAQTLHLFGPPTMEALSDSEVAVTWAMTDSVYLNEYEMYGGGFYDERWVHRAGEWWLRELKLRRTFVREKTGEQR